MSFPIMGAHFRPPAQAIINVLAANTSLTLRPEPENPYDANAIQILLFSKDFPEKNLEALENSLAHAGYDLDDFFSQEAWHLGYVPKGLAAILAPELAGETRQAWLRFELDGKPSVTTTDPGLDSSTLERIDDD